MDFKQVFQSNHYDEYPSQEKLKYLSHHLMGATDLNRYKILQGKAISSAYQHFWNDLNEFLQNGGDLLDQQTKNALETLLRQISNSSHLANEIDSITVMSKLTGNEKNQQEFLADLAYQVERAIFELPVGESLIIPHGYQSDSGGHATVLECKKINERDVIFKIINTGSGETQTESYKTLFLSLLKNSSTRPIKVTSELDMQKIFSNNFIEALLSSVIIHDAQAKERMNAVFVQLYYEGKLHDDEHFLSLQMNGTCSHSSLLEWLKTKVPNSIFLLFNLLTIEKAQARLEGVMQSYGPSIFSEDLSPVLSELHAAGIKTIAEAEGQFMAEKKRIREECKELKTQLSLLLGNKGKSIKPIDNFANYYRKKCAGTKLNTEELDQVTQADPLTSWKSSIGKKGWFSSVFNKKETLEALSERAQKTIIAKKISGHDAFLDAAQSVRKTF